MQGTGTWSCSKLMYQTVLNSHGNHYPLGVVNVEWTGGRGTEGGVAGELQMEYKIKLRNNLKLNLKSST